MLDEIRQSKLQKLENLKKAGIDPYPAKTRKDFSNQYVLENFEGLLGKEIALTGRIRSLRQMGALIFCHIEDESGKIQILLKKDVVGEGQFKLFLENIDIGDFVQIEGELFLTKTQEKTLNAKSWKILTKALLPFPVEFYGIKDQEELLRKRYLDILFNPSLKDLIRKKTIFWNAVREFHTQHGFLEVETPILETTTGGADARPFITHHNALDMDVYLRISAGELWQKRLMVAGFDKTFEIGRIFRNEGMSAEHAQDYTQCEAYWAYGSYEDMYKFLRDCYRFVAQKTFGTLKFEIHGFEIDLGDDWSLIDYTEEIKKQTGIDIWKDSEEKMIKKLNELKVIFGVENKERIIDALWKYCRKNITGPAIVINEPKITSPLSKSVPNKPEITERFHFIIAGSEIGQGYSELNDPIDQKERFEKQQALRDAGDEEAQMADYDFIEALEYGMPPTCGHGFSERLFSFLADKPIRECQIFPLVKSKNSSDKLSAKKDSEIIGDLGIDYVTAKKLVDKYITNQGTLFHSLESEAIMKALAERLGEDEEKWGIIGLLHDIDWDLTKENTKEHCAKMIGILKEAGASEFLIETILSHGYGNADCGASQDKERTTKLQHLLAAAETSTGLITAAALMTPDKKLNSLKIESLLKRFKEKKFAAKCDRQIILECEKAGLSPDEFLAIGLETLQKISDKIEL